MIQDVHKSKVRDYILANQFYSLHPIEIIQLKNGSFDLIVTEKACPANGYKRKEYLRFFKPTKKELFLKDKLIDELNSGMIH